MSGPGLLTITQDGSSFNISETTGTRERQGMELPAQKTQDLSRAIRIS